MTEPHAVAAAETAQSGRKLDRVVGFDLARSFAIATMVLINFQVYLLTTPTGDVADIWLRWLAHAPSGRSSATFVILAGCGIAQMSRTVLATGDGRAWWLVCRTLFLRSLFLVVAGNLLILVWSIDILHFYAFYLLFAIPFVRARGWMLLASAVTITSVTTVLAATMPWLEDYDLPYHSPLGMVANVLGTGIHPIFPWLSFVLYGMWLGRQDLRDVTRRRRFLLAGALAAVGVEILGGALSALAIRGLLPVPAEGIALLGTSWSPEPLYVLGACSTSTFVVALGHELAARWPASVLVRALVSTGQVSLSIYLLHALVGVGIPRWAYHLENGMPIDLVVAYWAVFIVLVIAGAFVYRRFFDRGPIETVMRFLTGTGGEGIPAFDVVWAALRALWDARANGLRAMGSAAEQTLASTGAGSLEHWAAALRARSATPGPTPATTTTTARSIPRALGWAVALAGAALVLVSRVLGTSPPTLGCPEPASIAVGHVVTSQLTMICPRVHFDLDVTSRAGLVVETRSGTDVLVEIHREDGALVASDDDSGPGLDARIHTALPPGRYDVIVRPYSATSGPFVLATHELAAPGG